jgi:hypothetical protein
MWARTTYADSETTAARFEAPIILQHFTLTANRHRRRRGLS